MENTNKKIDETPIHNNTLNVNKIELNELA